MGKDATLKDLREKHDAILIATGVYKAREVDLPGDDLANIFPAMDFLTASNKKGLGDKVELFDNGTLNAKRKKCCSNWWWRYSDGLCENSNKTRGKFC